MTQIQVYKDERDAIEKEFAHFDIKVEFFTVERNEKLLLAQVHCDDPCLMWKIGKFTGQGLGLEILKKAL